MSKSETEEIKQLVEQRVAAIRAKDAERATSMMSADSVLFDVIAPLQSKGARVAKNRAEEWFASFQAATIGYEIHGLQISAGDGVAFSHGLNHVSATKLDGSPLVMWWRATVCYRKIEGRWQITHEHNSVPFDVSSGMASLDLKP